MCHVDCRVAVCQCAALSVVFSDVTPCTVTSTYHVREDGSLCCHETSITRSQPCNMSRHGAVALLAHFLV